ncbi:hypothetical protein [Streptomyces fractus]|uniref:phage tail tube protein n=1 Tax=Streptomyces fractus TaxID=641806 RepID=UPI003CEC70E7
MSDNSANSVTSTKKASGGRSRFFRRGIAKIYWVKNLADPEHPTRTEISEPNRFDLTDAVASVEGWALSNEAIETPDMGSTFNSSIPGNDTAEDSSLTFYEDRYSNEVEQQLTKGAAGYLLLLRKGDIPGSPSMDVFPAQVATRSASYTTDNEAAQFEVSFTITEEPALDTVVPKAIIRQPKPARPGSEHRRDGEEGEHVDVTVVATAATATVHDSGEE